MRAPSAEGATYESPTVPSFEPPPGPFPPSAANRGSGVVKPPKTLTPTRSYEDFNERKAPGIGDIMQNGIRFLRAGLMQLTPEKVAILVIG